jgi:hypothetical protein
LHTRYHSRERNLQHNFGAVLLDISFDGQFAFEFADILQEANVPFAFVTGYDNLVEPRHELIPVLQEPFTLVQLRALLVTLVGSVRSNQQIARSA